MDSSQMIVIENLINEIARLRVIELKYNELLNSTITEKPVKEKNPNRIAGGKKAAETRKRNKNLLQVSDDLSLTLSTLLSTLSRFLITSSNNILDSACCELFSLRHR